MMLSSQVNEPESNAIVVGVLGASPSVLGELSQVCPRHISLLSITGELLDSEVSLACDAIVGILDGNLGVSASLISAWKLAADHDLPRIVLATNTADGRADFDEALALAELVLAEDIVVRYYPIEADESASYIGLLDVLVHEITQPGMPTKSADQEHVDLTSDDHDELVEALVHLDLDSEILANHNSGLPISLPRLNSIWNQFSFVTVLPMDGNVSADVLGDWFASLQPQWLPIVAKGDVTSTVNQTDFPVGIGIANGVARIWNTPAREQMELHTESNETLQLTSDEVSSHLFLDHRVCEKDIIRPLHSNVLIVAPRI